MKETERGVEMELEKMMKALGEPMRLKIYRSLLQKKHCVRSLAGEMGITESAVSQHLKVMREAGLIYGEKYGYHTHYFPRQDAVDFLARCFEQMREQSVALGRDGSACHCKFRKEGRT